MQNSVSIMQKQEKLSNEGDLWHNLGGGNTQIITQRFENPQGWVCVPPIFVEASLNKNG